jgi:hypothetical protein
MAPARPRAVPQAIAGLCPAQAIPGSDQSTHWLEPARHLSPRRAKAGALHLIVPAAPGADCAHDADKLERLFQAIEYRDSGYQKVGGWIESSRARLRAKSAQLLADAAVGMTLQDWHAIMNEPSAAPGGRAGACTPGAGRQGQLRLMLASLATALT